MSVGRNLLHVRDADLRDLGLGDYARSVGLSSSAVAPRRRQHSRTTLGPSSNVHSLTVVHPPPVTLPANSKRRS